jgi:hypothetical protein
VSSRRPRRWRKSRARPSPCTCRSRRGPRRRA